MARHYLVCLHRSLLRRTHGEGSSKFALAAISCTIGIRTHPLPYPEGGASYRICRAWLLVFSLMAAEFQQANLDFLEIQVGCLFVARMRDNGFLRRVPPTLYSLPDLITARCRTRRNRSPVLDSSDSDMGGDTRCASRIKPRDWLACVRPLESNCRSGRIRSPSYKALKIP